MVTHHPCVVRKMSNSGKDFEEDFKKSVGNQVALTRLYDVVGGNMGVAHICDFIVGFSPWTFYLELKSTKTNTLPLRNISTTQYEGLLDKSKYRGNIAGLLIQYRKYGEHYFVPIQEIEYLRNKGRKSVQIKDIHNKLITSYPFPATLKRTRYNYNFLEFIKLFGGSEFDTA